MPESRTISTAVIVCSFLLKYYFGGCNARLCESHHLRCQYLGILNKCLCMCYVNVSYTVRFLHEFYMDELTAYGGSYLVLLAPSPIADAFEII